MSEDMRIRISLREWRPKDWLTPARRRSLVIGRVTQLTEVMGIPVDHILPGTRMEVLPSDRITLVKPLYMLYVFRQNGQVCMIVNRVSPFQYERMMLTEAEMLLVMEWANKMVADDIGSFTPADGGWMWWRK